MKLHIYSKLTYLPCRMACYEIRSGHMFYVLFIFFVVWIYFYFRPFKEIFIFRSNNNCDIFESCKRSGEIESMKEGKHRGDSRPQKAEKSQLPNIKLNNAENFKSAAESNGNRPTEIDDVYISVKTTMKNHKTRMKVLLETWLQTAINQTYIFTDYSDKELASQLPAGHLINTGCPRNYLRQSICCKFEKEYEHFMRTNKRWFCHVDDDNYLIIDNLLRTLRRYDHKKLWYLGRTSKEYANPPPERPKLKHIRFVFATTGAGVCLSRALTNKLFRFMGNGRFVFTGNVIAMPDDCTLGYIVNHLLKLNLTFIKDFHSHLERMKELKNPEKSITIGYFKDNVINIDGFSLKDDPTRFRSLHCKLHPETCEHLGNIYDYKDVAG